MNIENNKLIVEFLGYQPCHQNLYKIGDDFNSTTIFSEYQEEDEYLTIEVGKRQLKFEPSEMLFSSSWDWLMPVVEKIETLGYKFEKNYQRVDKDWQSLIVKGNDILFQEFNKDSKLSTNYVVVEFIKWYNEKELKMP